MIEYADLDQRTKDELLTNSANLMRTITETWGPEKGMELWEKIADTLGQDLKGALFFSMITGSTMGDVCLSKINPGVMIEIIKTIRTYSGLGLKEAKDIYDFVRNGGTMNIAVTPKERAVFLKKLLDHGCEAR